MNELSPQIDPKLYQNKKVFDHEIVYEVTSQRDGLPFGIAIADIEQSVPHYHRKTVETYTGVQGELEVRVGEDTHVLRPGDVLQIPIGTIHSARSLGEDPARITVTTVPEWSVEDHFLAE